MKRLRVDGPVLVLEFEGDVKDKAMNLPYAAAAWLDDGVTRIVVKTQRDLSDEQRASVTQQVEQAIGQASKGFQFNNNGCDTFVVSDDLADQAKPFIASRVTDSEGARLDREIDLRIMHDTDMLSDLGYWREHPEEVRKIARLVHKRYTYHPLIIDAIKRMNRHVTNTRAEHAIGMKFWGEAMCAATILKPEDEPDSWGEGDPTLPNIDAIVPLVLLRCADIYLWTEKMSQLASSAPLPKHTISKTAMQGRTMFWAHEYPHGGEIVTSWVVLSGFDDCIVCAHDAMRGSDFRVMRFEIPYGMTWPNDFDENEVDTIGGVLKRCAFLNSPFVTTAKQKIARHVRRQMQRADQEPPDDDVSVVILRRLQVKKPKHQPNGEHHGVEWKHHWWVGDHYRAQWYPSEQAHHVIWIAPFVKGDLTKPLLEKIYKVAR